MRCGGTLVHCTASVEDRVPPFMRGRGTGWITAEYSMLPRATGERTPRDISKGKLSGRSSEIQRLIGRSLRGAVDMTMIGERTIRIDCDVLQADGGTRTASITAGFMCTVDALRSISCVDALQAQVAAISAGIVGGTAMLDLCYAEDSSADVDCNVVMDSSGRFIELQGTGEGASFSRDELDEMLALAERGLAEIFDFQRRSLDLSAAERQLFASLASKR